MSKATPKQTPPSKSPESRKQRRIVRNLFKAQMAQLAAEEDGDAEAVEYFSQRAEHLQSQLETMELEIRKLGKPKAEKESTGDKAEAQPEKKVRRSKKVEVAETADVLEAVA